MTKTLPILFVLGLSLVACSASESAPAKPAPAPAPPAAPVAKPAPAPAKAPAPAPAPAPAAAAKPDAMKAASALFEAQKYAEAATAFEAITKAEPQNGDAWFLLGLSLHLSKQLDRALVAHAKAAEFPKLRAESLYNLGCAHALLGHPDAAFEALNKALDSGFKDLKNLQEDPDLQSLRADPRYTALVERLSKPKA